MYCEYDYILLSSLDNNVYINSNIHFIPFSNVDINAAVLPGAYPVGVF